MRKLYLFAILITAAAVNLCNAKEPYHLELYGDSQKTGGTRFSTPVTEFRVASRPEKINFGLLFTSENLFKKLPIEFKYGNLSFAGSLSKLNSPELSNGTSPFSSSSLSASCVTANLPGYSSFSKAESAFMQMKLNHLARLPFLLTMNMAVNPETSSPLFSTLISKKFFSNQLSLSASFTSGSFIYEDKNSSSWFLDSPYYAEDEGFCSLLQISSDYRKKKSRNGIHSAFMAAFYESPFGPYTVIYRSDLKFNIHRTEFFLSAFLNEYEDTLTSSGKELNPCTQFKAGFISKKPFLTGSQKLLFIKYGINAFTRINLTKEEHPLRINTGIQLSSDLTAISFSVSADSKILSPSPDTPPKSLEKDSFTFQIKNSWNLKKITPVFSATAEADHYKFAAGLSFPPDKKNYKISSNCAFSFSTEDGEIADRKISASLNCRFNYKMLTIIGKLSATIE